MSAILPHCRKQAACDPSSASLVRGKAFKAFSGALSIHDVACLFLQVSWRLREPGLFTVFEGAWKITPLAPQAKASHAPCTVCSGQQTWAQQPRGAYMGALGGCMHARDHRKTKKDATAWVRLQVPLRCMNVSGPYMWRVCARRGQHALLLAHGWSLLACASRPRCTRLHS